MRPNRIPVQVRGVQKLSLLRRLTQRQPVDTGCIRITPAIRNPIKRSIGKDVEGHPARVGARPLPGHDAVGLYVAGGGECGCAVEAFSRRGDGFCEGEGVVAGDGVAGNLGEVVGGAVDSCFIVLKALLGETGKEKEGERRRRR